jgi:alpha-beta hydrolase superfamily lysophospholipase
MILAENTPSNPQTKSGIALYFEIANNGGHELPRIDSQHVFLLGHSMGGTLVPRIAAENPGISGLIIMAGATRPLPELMVEQAEYVASLGNDSAGQ